MDKKLLYRREDRIAVGRIFTLLECLALVMATILVGLLAFA